MLEFIDTAAAPPANGHYSQAVVANGFVFVAAQLPIMPGTAAVLADGIAAQAQQALANVAAILEAASSDLNHLVSVTLFVTEIGLWPIVDRVYGEVLCQHRPARGVLVSPQLHLGALVAVQAIAVVANSPVSPPSFGRSSGSVRSFNGGLSRDTCTFDKSCGSRSS